MDGGRRPLRAVDVENDLQLDEDSTSKKIQMNNSVFCFYVLLCDRYACGHQRVSGQVTMRVAAVMAASPLRLFSILALTVLVVPVSSAEDHEWHFNPGRAKINLFCNFMFQLSFFFSKELSRGCLLLKHTNLSPSSSPLGQKKQQHSSLCGDILRTSSDQEGLLSISHQQAIPCPLRPSASQSCVIRE